MAMSHRYWELPRLSERNGISCLRIKTRPTPKPEAGEVLIAVKAVSLNYRDLVVSSNDYTLFAKDEPTIPVSDGAGVVAEVGEGVVEFRAGDRVVVAFSASHQQGPTPTQEDTRTGFGAGLDGLLTEYACIPAHALVLLPASISFAQAATLPCAAVTAWNSLFGLSGHTLQPGQTVLCEGTGGVSLFAAQFAIATGAKCIITSSSVEKVYNVLQRFSKDEQKRISTINYLHTPKWDERIQTLTNERGVDHVIEVGGAGTLERALRSVKMGGVVSNIGLVAGSSAVSEPPNVSGLIRSKAAIYRGILIGSKEHLEAVVNTVNANTLSPLIDRTFAFEDAVRAYEHLRAANHFGKVVIRVAE